MGPGAVLGAMGMVVMGVLVVVVVMVMMRGERRAGKHHQEQNGGKNFLHAENVTRVRLRR